MVSLMRITKVHVLLVLMLILLLAAAGPVSAAEIKVDGKCSLRNAIKSANDDKARGDCAAGDGDDVIILKRDTQPGLGQLPAVEGTIFLEGLGHTLRIDNDHPVFRVEGGDFTVRHLNVEYFPTPRKARSFRVTDGSLTLINVIVENCLRGIELFDGDASVHGTTNICDLPRDLLITGDGDGHVNLPVPQLPDTCSAMPGANTAVSATYGQHSGVQCQHLDGSGIGIQSIIDAGFIAAVDVWGYVEQGVEICFPQLGSITFLDASTSPRTVSTIDSYSRGNSTCTQLTRAGSVILMPGTPTGAAPAPAGQPAAAQPVTTLVAGPVQPGCPLVATGHLKHLAEPKSEAELIGYVTRGTTVTVVSRIPGWYQVTHGGQTGWVGGKYTAGTGTC